MHKLFVSFYFEFSLFVSFILNFLYVWYLYLGNFTGSYEMTVSSDGDNSGMSLGYLINYALLPCSVAALPPSPGEGS